MKCLTLQVRGQNKTDFIIINGSPLLDINSLFLASSRLQIKLVQINL